MPLGEGSLVAALAAPVISSAVARVSSYQFAGLCRLGFVQEAGEGQLLGRLAPPFGVPSADDDCFARARDEAS